MLNIKRRQPLTQAQFGLVLHPVLQRIYLNRGIGNDADLQRELKELLHYEQLPGIRAAVSLLFAAMQQRKKILIIGDYDVDGATSVALLMSALQAMGVNTVDYLVPDRFRYGYGLTVPLVESAEQRGAELLITVDNGITSLEGVLRAKQLGLQVLITDHHLPGSVLPTADAIVNPNLAASTFPSKALAGVGVVFYLVMALRVHCREQGWFAHISQAEPNLACLLDLVALGTVADVVPLDHNNRVLVYQGMKRIRQGLARPGIYALLEVAKRESESLQASDLAFALAPRLNAAGRLQDMSVGIACLLAPSLAKAREHARVLDALNHERRGLQTEMTEQALLQLEQQLRKQTTLPKGLCLYDPSWHQGVIGILAGRLKDKFHRPAIVFAPGNEGELKGSARSIPQLNIRDVLAEVSARNPKLLQKFGGHAMAAGASIETIDYPAFQKLFEQVVDEHLRAEDLQPDILTDGVLTSAEFSFNFAKELQEAGPFGQHFPEPSFDGIFEVLEQRVVGAKHLKMLLREPESKQILEAICFFVDLNAWPNHRCQTIQVVYQLDLQIYQSRPKLQLLVRYLAVWDR